MGASLTHAGETRFNDLSAYRLKKWHLGFNRKQFCINPWTRKSEDYKKIMPELIKLIKTKARVYLNSLLWGKLLWLHLGNVVTCPYKWDSQSLVSYQPNLFTTTTTTTTNWTITHVLSHVLFSNGLRRLKYTQNIECVTGESIWRWED